MKNEFLKYWLGTRALVCFTALLMALPAFGQIEPEEPGEPYSMAFYNVENLFDNVDDPAIDDDEFLPESPKQWTVKRYRKKLEDLAKVIDAIPVQGLPDLLGLCEVENLTVLLDLAKEQELSLAGYLIVHKNSPDRRGIDVALLYKPDKFRVVHEEFFTTPLATSGNPTRDVLYAKGIAMEQDTVHVFVNHWPSRYGGVEKSNPNRIALAELVSSRVDSLQCVHPDSKIVVMGDFNDNPTDRSMSEVLGGAVIPNATDQPLFNLHASAYSEKEGTFNYRGDWSMLDQILVSWPIINATDGLYCSPDAGEILREPFMIYTNKQGVEYPNKTYGGERYFGGISDHLPVYVNMEFLK